MSASKLILVANLNAFLDTVSFSEGTQVAGSDDGYDVVVGGQLFRGYAAPQKYSVWIQRIGDYSSAIGRYQILYKYAVHYMAQLNLPDFGPRSQDKIALQLIRECKATQLIIDGAISNAITACSSRWASFPGNNYKQRQEKMDNLLQFFVAAGGTVK